VSVSNMLTAIVWIISSVYCRSSACADGEALLPPSGSVCWSWGFSFGLSRIRLPWL